jgi:hypothetical protein
MMVKSKKKTMALPQNLWVNLGKRARLRIDRRVLPPTFTITSPGQVRAR